DPASDTTVFSVSASGSGTVTSGAAGTISSSTTHDYEDRKGAYSVAETVPAGWDKTADTCQAVAVAAGQTVDCTITNVKRGHLIVHNSTDPASDPAVFSVTASGSGTVTSGAAGTVSSSTTHDY